MTKSYGSVVEYRRALRKVEREGIHQSHLALLRAHIAARRHTLSWRELAPRVGYANAEAVKLHYGSLARRIAEHMGVVRRPGFWLNVLTSWGPKPDRRGHTTFTLRPEVIKAVRALHWFSKSGRSRAREIGSHNLHIVQGGIENGDKEWLEHAAQRNVDSRSWVTPRSALIGDDVVVYVGSYGFFATARIASLPRPRRDWARRYGCALDSIRLIEPAISLAAIQRHIPELTWSLYPRSITTPPANVANAVRVLIEERRRTHLPDLDADALDSANIDELRRVALLRATPSVPVRKATVLFRARSQVIREYSLRRAKGRCEGCSALAPFRTAQGRGYLEPHHTTRLADEGPDHPARVIALCPNCHRRAHYAADAQEFNALLKRKLVQLEPSAGHDVVLET